MLSTVSFQWSLALTKLATKLAHVQVVHMFAVHMAEQTKFCFVEKVALSTFPLILVGIKEHQGKYFFVGFGRIFNNTSSLVFVSNLYVKVKRVDGLITVLAVQAIIQIVAVLWIKVLLDDLFFVIGERALETAPLVVFNIKLYTALNLRLASFPAPQSSLTLGQLLPSLLTKPFRNFLSTELKLPGESAAPLLRQTGVLGEFFLQLRYLVRGYLSSVSWAFWLNIVVSYFVWFAMERHMLL